MNFKKIQRFKESLHKNISTKERKYHETALLYITSLDF